MGATVSSGNLFSPDRELVVRQLPLEQLVAAGWPGIDHDSYLVALQQAGEVIGKNIAPKGPENDKLEFRIERGRLVLPAAVEDYRQTIRDLGIPQLFISERYGGLEAPRSIMTAYAEMLWQADPGLAAGTLLTGGNGSLLQTFGSEEVKQLFLPGIAAGRLSASMNLTEQTAGSDVWSLQTKAVPKEDGTARLYGQKMFISWPGDVQMVLARDTDSQRISLYAVPLEIDGHRNDVDIIGIERKLGLHSSPTCTIAYGEEGSGAIGFLVGERDRGLQHMFQMMNDARQQVAGQGIAMIEAAFQAAREYAQNRKQFGKPIAEFYLVQQMLADMNIHAQVLRAVVSEAVFASDLATIFTRNGELEKAAPYANLTAVLTPAIKYRATEEGIRLARSGLQIHGGYGYITDVDAERHLRNSVIATIYEGTSEIQVTSFLGEALLGMRGEGRANVNPVLQQMRRELSGTTYSHGLEEVKPIVLDAIDRIQHHDNLTQGALPHLGMMYMEMMERHPELNPREVLNYVAPGAKPLANMVIDTYGAMLLMRQAQRERTGEKAISAQYFIQQVLQPNLDRDERQIGGLNSITLELMRKVALL